MNFHKKSEPVDGSLAPDISKWARTACILHLCIAFSVLFWILGAPFTEALYLNKKASKELEWLTIEHEELYNTLPQSDQKLISSFQKKISLESNESFQRKMAKSVESFFLGMPVSKLLWLFLSILLPVLVMKQIDGARESFWLLPLLTAVYAWQMMPIQSTPSIYPTETYLEKKYLKGPLSGSIEEQRDMLELAWKSYIIEEWTQAPKDSSDGEKFANGMYHFIAQKTLLEMNQPPQKPGPWTLGAYLMWNLSAAFCIFFSKVPIASQLATTSKPLS